jgi:hypothetical protein
MNMVHRLGAIVTVVVLAAACTETSTPSQDVFNRQQMLQEVADGLIVPAFDTLLQRTDLLAAAVQRLSVSSSPEDVASAQHAWVSVAEAWQDARLFSFGPAEGMFGTLAENIGTYPVSVSKITARIEAGDTALRGFDRDAWGIYGAEYLLWNDPLTVHKLAYLRAVVAKVRAEVVSVAEAWRQGYRSTFVGRNGTDPGSGTSMLFNATIFSFEQMKNYGLGLPLGRLAGQSGPEPQAVEAYYSGRSRDLLKRHYAAVMRIWEGALPNGTKIQGFRDYLTTVANGQRLIDETLVQHHRVEDAFASVPTSEPLSDLVRANDASVMALHTEVLKLTRFLKSELSSLLGIAITYSSGDGD